LVFGPIMRVPVGDLTIELAPLTRDCMEAFIENGGMQSHTVTRFLGRRSAPTLENEIEWYEKVSADAHVFSWGIWVIDGDDRIVIGTSGLHDEQDWALNIWSSGSMIFRPDFWGRGIGTRCHMARTWFAFNQMRLDVIRSSALVLNGRSLGALKRCGYEQVGLRRNARFVDGHFVHEALLECVNPTPLSWRQWWQDERVPRAFQQARTRTLAACAWADQNVTLL